MCVVGIPVFGPTALAARMEGSKAFSKAFMERHSIPTAKFRVFTSSQYNDAVEYVKTCGFQTVLKASGLAAGKGVLIPATVDEAIAGLKEIMVDSVFGTAGPRPCRVYTILSFNIFPCSTRRRGCYRRTPHWSGNFCPRFCRRLHRRSFACCSGP